MKISETGIIDLSIGTVGPLCPRAGGPVVDPAHALHARHVDAVYEATPRDADGEPATPELAKVRDAIGYGFGTSERMSLFRDTATVLDHGGRTVVVEALYFQCAICGLILPANRVPSTP